MTSTFFTILPNAATLSEATSVCKRKQFCEFATHVFTRELLV